MISGIDYGKGNDESCTVTFVSPEYIKNLEEENNQLKEQRQELRSWLEEQKQDRYYANDPYRYTAYDIALKKLNELENKYD